MKVYNYDFSNENQNNLLYLLSLLTLLRLIIKMVISLLNFL